MRLSGNLTNNTVPWNTRAIFNSTDKNLGKSNYKPGWKKIRPNRYAYFPSTRKMIETAANKKSMSLMAGV
jgi:hypothetical protein